MRPLGGSGGGHVESSAEIEVRVDPLTGHRCRINQSRDQRPKQPLAVETTKGGAPCPFCPENLERSTPEFRPGLFAEKRIRYGGAVLFPNLFPLSEMHGVCVFTPVHKVDLDEFTAKEIFDGIKCCIEFISRCRTLGVINHLIGWNHLSQAGASMLHPHFQAIASRHPFSSILKLVELSRSYHASTKSSYWEVLVREERGSSRMIGTTGGFNWLAPWSPTGSYEVMGVCSSPKSSITELGDAEVMALAEGILKVINGYWAAGAISLNMAIFSSACEGEYFRVHARLMARPIGSISDRAFLELYGNEVGISVPPERYAGWIREKF